MNILVTGATGFIGSNLVKRLITQKHKVKVLVRNNSNLNKIEKIKQVERVLGDLTDYNSLLKAMKGIDVVFNLAAALPYHKLSDDQYWSINADGVKNVVKACLKANVGRLVHVSTVGVYGQTSPEGVDESAQLVLTDAYSKSKAAGDKNIFDAIKKQNLQATIIRPTIAYGPGDTRPGFSNLFPLMKKGLFIPVGNGENYFHTTYIENLIDALLIASSHKKALGQDFIIGDDPCPKMKEIINTIAKVEGVNLPGFYIPTNMAEILAKLFEIGQMIGLPAPLTTQRVKFITQNRKYNINKAQNLLGYQPKIDLKEGVSQTYLWYKEHGYIG